MGAFVGIDLGTTNSLCAVYEKGAPRLILNASGDFLTPSVVGFLEDGHTLVGRPARDFLITRPERTAACFKRWMGIDRTVQMGRQTFTAPELSSLVLRSLAQDAENHLGVPVRDAVITVPAYFNEHQRQATKMAGELAGLNVRRIINEPTAAALTYGFHDRQTEKTLLVFDLGGGTFDVTVMEVFEGTLEIVSTTGESFLGGEDFTDRMASRALEGQGLQLEAAELRQPLRVARLRAECERAKLDLTRMQTTFIRMPGKDGHIAPDAPALPVSRADFADCTKPLLDRLSGPLDRALRDAGREPRDIDDVILVGGASRMLQVRDHVAERFNKPPLVAFDPDHVVALGAAVQTALMEDDRFVVDMVMTDVCPFTLGVDIVKEFGSAVREGYFLPVIHRNTTIPVSREEIVATVQNNQREMLVRVFQGESRRTEDNLFLGDLTVSGLPPARAGLPVHLRFTYDLNGILEVEAFVPDTGKKYQVVLRHNVKGLSEVEFKKAVKNLQKLKFYPRDEVRNQQLIRYAERLVGEVSPLQRQELEERIDQFEGAMAAGDRDGFRFARRELLILLSSLGYPADGEAESSEE